jgi:hypothetical protein
VNADGSDLQQLFSAGSSGPVWSPDGTEIQVFCCGDGMIAHFVDPATGELVRTLSPPDPALEIFCGGSWSPDGERLSCEGFGVEDPSLNGAYSPEWSPDGSMIVFTRSSSAGRTENIYIVHADGTGLRQVTNGGTDDNPDWGTPPGDG